MDFFVEMRCGVSVILRGVHVPFLLIVRVMDGTGVAWMIVVCDFGGWGGLGLDLWSKLWPCNPCFVYNFARCALLCMVRDAFAWTCASGRWREG